MTEPKIIIQIDDDEINNFINESIFRSNTKITEIKSFTNPIKALNYIKKDFLLNPVSAIFFLDINMPEMTGWEMLEDLGEYANTLNEFVIIYMISSSIDTIDRNKSIDNPLVKDFLSKPLSGKVIKQILEI